MHLTELYSGVLRRFWLVLLLGAVFAGGAFLFSRALPRVYAANATVIVGRVLTGDPTNNEILAAQRLAQAFAELASTRSVAERVAASLDLDEAPAILQTRITGQAQAESLFVVVTARADEAELAASIANAVASELVRLSPSAPPTSQGPTGPLLSVLEAAEAPQGPESPRTALNVAIGGLLGVAVSLALIFMLELMDRTVRGPDRIRYRTGLPVLGTVRSSPTDDLHAARRLVMEGESVEIRDVMTRLAFLTLGTQSRLFVVASPSSLEGRTTVAVGLALSFSIAGHSTLLVDGDLRSPSVHRAFGLTNAPGLGAVLEGSGPTVGLAQRTAYPNLAVVTAGTVDADPSRLLASPRAEAFFSWARETADVVIVDTPPLLVVTDAAHLATLADATLLVVRPDRTTVDELTTSAEVLARVGVKPIGVVATERGRRRRSPVTSADIAHGAWGQSASDDQAPAAQGSRAGRG
jgi:capsular exopolysaccharide synthesis family protein